MASWVSTLNPKPYTLKPPAVEVPTWVDRGTLGPGRHRARRIRCVTMVSGRAMRSVWCESVTNKLFERTRRAVCVACEKFKVLGLTCIGH
jgi:hypothetical protein